MTKVSEDKKVYPKLVLRIAINTAVGIILVVLWLQFVDIKEILKVLKTTNLKFTLAFFIFFILSSLLRSLRLKLFLHTQKIPFKSLIYLNFLSQFLSFLIPIRAGEITKSVYLSTQFNLSFGKTIIWILLDRFMDFWVTLFLISILIFIVPTTLPSNFEQIVFIVLGTFSILTILMINSSKLARKLINFFSNFLIFPKLKNIFLNTAYSITEGFIILRRHPLELLVLLFISVLAVVSDSLIWFSMLVALGINIGFLATLLGSLLSALTFLIPAAPGYVGSAEASALAVFSGVLGIDPNRASATAILVHILNILIMAILGLGSLYLLKIDLKLVWKKIFKR